MTIAMYALLFGVILVLSASAVWGLWWAIRGGQYSDFAKGATSIFDEEEPVGRRTDRFPDQKITAEAQRIRRGHREEG